MTDDFLMLSGKVALFTGAGSGIGRASAMEVAKAGAQVVVSDVDVTGGNETVEAIKRAGGEATFVAADVSNNADVEALVGAAVTKYGRLDFAHNNAGIESPMVSTMETRESDWDRSIAVNLKGVWLCMRAELRQMVQQGGGSIVNTASAGGFVAVPGNVAYSAAKAGVINMSRTAAVEFADHNIRVNALCPGLTRSGMTDRLLKTAPELMESILPPMRRFAQPAEMAGTVAFLFSHRASYLTGQAIVVDGGALAAP